MSTSAVEVKEQTVGSLLPADHPYMERNESIIQRINSVTEYQKQQPENPAMRQFSQHQNHLVSLIGPENAAPFLKMLAPPTSDIVATVGSSTADAIYEIYNDNVKLQEAMSRMINLMVKAYDNGEYAVENIEQYGNVNGVDLVNSVIAKLESGLVEARKEWFYHVADRMKFPCSVMQDIHWSIAGIKYASRDEFDEAVHQYRLEICISGYWDPAMIAVLAPRIRIDWAYADGEEYPSILEFESDNGLWFTEGELLFKIHNALVDQCNELDHRYFEGINLDKQQEPGKPPLYSFFPGS